MRTLDMIVKLGGYFSRESGAETVATGRLRGDLTDPSDGVSN
jgi:hypothetical protein